MTIPGLTIGVGSYFGPGLQVRRWRPNETVTVGKYCSIADRVELFCGGGHRTSTVSTYPFDQHIGMKADSEARSYKHPTGPTTIGNDVWIASGAVIMPGVIIGDGAVIHPHTVVYRDVEPYEVVRGNPAYHERNRFGYKVIEELLKIAWWDWPEETIKERIDDFYLPVGDFVAKYRC